MLKNIYKLKYIETVKKMGCVVYTNPALSKSTVMLNCFVKAMLS